MSSLKHVDRIKLEKFLEMGSGYVSDFSDRTFRDFILETVDVDVYKPEYEEGGTSKANRLRTFWKKEVDFKVAKLLEQLIEYQKIQKQNTYDGITEEDLTLYRECLKIVRNLGIGTNINSTDDFTKKTDEELNIIKEQTAENAYVPGSVYHKADRELIRRHRERIETAAATPKVQIGILNKGRDNKFIGNVFEGFGVGIQDEGEGTLAKQNKFFNAPHLKSKDINWTKWGTIIAGVTLIIAILAWQLPKSTLFLGSDEDVGAGSVATSTIALSEILSKALSYDTVAERQDFLNKYEGTIVSGESIVTEVSRASSDFLVDFNVNRQLVTCWMPGGEENERRFILMKGKKIGFVGTFSFTNVYGHGLGLDNCDLEQI